MLCGIMANWTVRIPKLNFFGPLIFDVFDAQVFGLEDFPDVDVKDKQGNPE